MSSNHCSLGQYLRLPPLSEGKVFCLYVLSILHIYFSFLSTNLSELLTTIYESPAYLSLKSWKEKLTQNIFRNYETLLEISLHHYKLRC